MSADISWYHRALELIERHQVETAYNEIGPQRMTLFFDALRATRADPENPMPGEPAWDQLLTRMQEAREAWLPPATHWWQHSAELIEQGDLPAAEAEIGDFYAAILFSALEAGRRRPGIIPRPGEPGWEEYLGGLVAFAHDGPAARPEPLRIPVITVPGTVTVTLTEVWDTEPWLPPHLRDRGRQ